MTKLYQIFNYQNQPVKVCETLDEAKRYILSLKETYSEKFYVVELEAVYVP